MFGNPNIGFYAGHEYTSSSMIPVLKHVPRWKESGRIEQGLFESTNELSSRVTDDFLIEMARESREEREKSEAEMKKREEERKRSFLKNKWHKILNSMAKNYKGVDIESEILNPVIAAEVKRCMLIPSEFLRTKLVKDCLQCSKRLWEDREHYEHYKPLRHPHDEQLDFDGHFPEDHVQLEGFEEHTKEEQNKYEKKISFQTFEY